MCADVQRRAGAQREQRRPGRHPGPAAEERHLDAARGQVPVGEQRHHVPAAEPVGQHVERRRARPPVSGMISMPSASPERQEPLVHALRLEPLGDRGDRPAAGGDPGAGGVPVAGVRQRDDRARARRRRRSPSSSPRCRAGSRRRICSRDSDGSRNASMPVPGVRAQRRRGPARRTRPRAGPGRPPGAGCAASRGCPARAGGRRGRRPARKTGPRRPAAAAPAPAASRRRSPSSPRRRLIDSASARSARDLARDVHHPLARR